MKYKIVKHFDCRHKLTPKELSKAKARGKKFKKYRAYLSREKKGLIQRLNLPGYDDPITVLQKTPKFLLVTVAEWKRIRKRGC